MFATVWPSVLSLAARFQPKFATLITMRRPPGLAALAYRDCSEKDENQKKSSDVAGRGAHRIIVARLLSPPHALNAPERAMRAKLGDFAGGLFTEVNGNRNDADKRAHENHCHDPRRDVPDAERVIKRYDIGNRRTGVQKDFCEPRHQDQDENEYVIPLHPAPNCFQFRDFEAGQNQIFAYELFPFAL